MDISQKLADLGITLPVPATPVAAYLPCVEENGLLHISGQLPFRDDGSLMTGRLGDTLTEDEGADAARACALMVLAQAQAALGSLDAVSRVVKLGVFVASTPEFSAQPKVANGASELMQAVFGDAGRHARSAIGVAALPLSAAVEVDAIFAVNPR